METEKKPRSLKSKIRIIVILILIILLIIVSLQNTRDVELDIFTWKVTLPLVVLLAVNSVVVAIITFLWMFWRRRR